VQSPYVDPEKNGIGGTLRKTSFRWLRFFTGLSFIAIVWAGSVTADGQHAFSEPSPSERNAWLVQALAELEAFVPGDDDLPVVARPLILDGSTTFVYRIQGSAAFLAFPDHSWARLLLTSVHDQPRIGDAILAIDHLGRVYENAAHICGGIVHFSSQNEGEALSAEDFFARFSDQTYRTPWTSFLPDAN
jgi:hypothetical protein